MPWKYYQGKKNIYIYIYISNPETGTIMYACIDFNFFFLFLLNG